MNFWLKIAGALVANWVIAGAAIFWARSATPTAESVGAYVEKTNITSRTGEERQKAIERTAEMLNRLSYEERQQLRRSGVTDRFFRNLTPDEQTAFLDA